MKKFRLFFLLLTVYYSTGFTQPWTFRATVERMPDQRIFLAALKGDKQTVIDSTASLNGAFSFKPDENILPGVYRILLGSSKKADYYGRETRSFDVIFDHEDVVLRTDFIDPVKAMKVVTSDENRIYYSFIHMRSAYGAKFNALLTTSEYVR